MIYLFISEDKIEAYNGEILKRYVGNKLIKTIANPTEQDLIEFGYMEFVSTDEPEYNPETQYINTIYYIEYGKIYQKYTIRNLSNIIEEENNLLSN